MGVQQIEVSVPLIKEKVKELFEFYATFNYERYMVCPYFGRKHVAISKILKEMPKR